MEHDRGIIFKINRSEWLFGTQQGHHEKNGCVEHDTGRPTFANSMQQNSNEEHETSTSCKLNTVGHLYEISANLEVTYVFADEYLKLNHLVCLHVSDVSDQCQNAHLW